VSTEDFVTLWRPTGQVEFDLVAASGFRAWPPRLPEQPIFYPVVNRWYATKIAREWNVPAGGVGYVTSFDVRRAFLNRYDVHQVGGREVREYWIPAEDLDELNANIVGQIRFEASFESGVPDAEFDLAAAALGRPLPPPWRAFLQGVASLRDGEMASGCYVRIYTPRETVELVEAWGEAAALYPGVAIIGGDGSREHIVIDLRQEPWPVATVDIPEFGWSNSVRQTDSIVAFIEQFEAGEFTFVGF
jgi:hypothetical protein